ncbi:MAG: branched-chain amino acid ABC transporter permease [Thermodesulfobacteriota bacterium]|nr:branched-chain amino acid ABC transporter permease [Thermodesulfobacteriota bacterium]
MALRSKTFKESYEEDIALFHTIWVRSWWAIFIILLLTFPMWGDPYLVYLSTLTFIYIVAGMGLNILTGVAGQISLSQGAFVGVGAYTTAILSNRFNLPFPVTIPLAGIMAAASSVLIGVISLRIKGLYLAMATLAFGQFLQYVFVHWESFTKGVFGMPVPEMALGGFAFDTSERMYYPFLIITVLLLLAAKNFLRTRTGRAFVSVRDRDIAAECMGVNLVKYKIIAFTLSAFYAGIAGGFYAYMITHVNPYYFSFLLSVEYLLVIIVGGLGTVLGCALGGIFVSVLPECIKMSFDMLTVVFPAVGGVYNEEWNILFFGLMIIFFLLFEPGGLAAIYLRIKTSLKNWPFT